MCSISLSWCQAGLAVAGTGAHTQIIAFTFFFQSFPEDLRSASSLASLQGLVFARRFGSSWSMLLLACMMLWCCFTDFELE